jgi:hypothetical protein
VVRPRLTVARNTSASNEALLPFFAKDFCLSSPRIQSPNAYLDLVSTLSGACHT